ncbi:Uncharacterized protein HZ326_29914 [Fusarium oxysporum f. sp. albedinis]|nr:Uncharacterized protein HZ326_29914 [Fusarium oxysporum f. sp. albedinis]
MIVLLSPHVFLLSLNHRFGLDQVTFSPAFMGRQEHQQRLWSCIASIDVSDSIPQTLTSAISSIMAEFAPALLLEPRISSLRRYSTGPIIDGMVLVCKSGWRRETTP